MMRKQLMLLVTALLIVWSPALAAGEHGRSVDEVVQDILAVQEVSGQEQIDCVEVSEEQFDELGDAVMGAMIGDDERHEAMDNMMGGEGSESLKAMHVGMGQRYLGCGGKTGGTMGRMGGMMNMMGGSMGMMGGGMGMTPLGSGGFRGGDSSMMGDMFGLGSAMGWGGGMLLFWIIVIVGIGFFVAWLARQQNTSAGGGKGALDILKERYARGEIDKQEFETKKRDLI